VISEWLLLDHCFMNFLPKKQGINWCVVQIADGTDVLEALIGPLLDLCGVENVSTLWINVLFSNSLQAYIPVTCG